MARDRHIYTYFLGIAVEVRGLGLPHSITFLGIVVEAKDSGLPHSHTFLWNYGRGKGLGITTFTHIS